MTIRRVMDDDLVGLIGCAGRHDACSIDSSAGFGIAALKGGVTHGKSQTIWLEAAPCRNSGPDVI